jgi:hypothetical protein
MMDLNIAPESFIDLCKDIFLCIDGLYYCRFDSRGKYHPDNCDFSIIKWQTGFTPRSKFNDFLVYYEKNIAGKNCFIASDLCYLCIIFNDSGYGKRVHVNILAVYEYFDEVIGFSETNL